MKKLAGWGILWSLACAGAAQAAFLEPYWSARVAALGGAFVAVSDDASGVFYNVAGLTQAKRREGNFSYARLFAGLDGVKLSLSQVALVQPLGRIGVAGLGWGEFNSSGLYREDTVVAGFGRSLRELFGHWDGELALGVSGRFLSRTFTLDERTAGDPVFQSGNSRQTGTLDLHAFALPDPDLLPGLSLGFSVRSLNEPDIGYQDSEPQPREFAGGAAYRWGRFLIPAEVTARSNVLTPHVGMEVKLWPRITVRAGSDTYQFGSGLGYRLGSQHFAVIIDYSFILPLQLSDSSGSHRASLGLQF